jgi:hypothetical protein
MSLQPIITRRLGRQSDLARELEISDSAVSQLVRRYKIPKDLQGNLDLDYAKWMIREKGNARRQEAQRKKPKPAPKPETWNIREFLESLAGVWDSAILKTIEDNEGLLDADEVAGICCCLWQAFHHTIEQELLPQGDITAGKEWPQPPTLAAYLYQAEEQIFQHLQHIEARNEAADEQA